MNENFKLAEVKILVEEGNILAARKILADIRTPSGVCSETDYWRKILAEPKVTPGKTATGGGIKEDSLWLEKYASAYKGQWVALKAGILMGSNKSLIQLRRWLKDMDKLREATLFRV